MRKMLQFLIFATAILPCFAQPKTAGKSPQPIPSVPDQPKVPPAPAKPKPRRALDTTVVSMPGKDCYDKLAVWSPVGQAFSVNSTQMARTSRCSNRTAIITNSQGFAPSNALAVHDSELFANSQVHSRRSSGKQKLVSFSSLILQSALGAKQGNQAAERLCLWRATRGTLIFRAALVQTACGALHLHSG